MQNIVLLYHLDIQPVLKKFTTNPIISIHGKQSLALIHTLTHSLAHTNTQVEFSSTVYTSVTLYSNPLHLGCSSSVTSSPLHPVLLPAYLFPASGRSVVSVFSRRCGNNNKLYGYTSPHIIITLVFTPLSQKQSNELVCIFRIPAVYSTFDGYIMMKQ